ncbi:hypothetical protein Plhal304r1_c036g0111221 [Plasmopara halstedii]
MCPSRRKSEREFAKLRRKLWIIQEVSRIKNELLNLDAALNFRKTIVNRKYHCELETIFGVPFHCIKDRYLNLLNGRNHICHSHNSFRQDSVMPSYW